MNGSRLPPESPVEWLNRARSNLIRARVRTAGVYLEDLCFDAQQAAEKAVKAVLLAEKVDFPYVHDLGVLVKLVEATGARVPRRVRESAKLTRYALGLHYPGAYEPVSLGDYATALSLAEAVVGWATARLGAEADAGDL